MRVTWVQSLGWEDPLESRKATHSTIEQNYEMLSRLDEFRTLQVPVLVGVSRKSMIYRLLGVTPEESLPATQVVHLKALQGGADIFRVHDVAEIVRTVALYRVLG